MKFKTHRRAKKTTCLVTGIFIVVVMTVLGGAFLRHIAAMRYLDEPLLSFLLPLHNVAARIGAALDTIWQANITLIGCMTGSFALIVIFTAARKSESLKGSCLRDAVALCVAIPLIILLTHEQVRWAMLLGMVSSGSYWVLHWNRKTSPTQPNEKEKVPYFSIALITVVTLSLFFIQLNRIPGWGPDEFASFRHQRYDAYCACDGNPLRVLCTYPVPPGGQVIALLIGWTYNLLGQSYMAVLVLAAVGGLLSTLCLLLLLNNLFTWKPAITGTLLFVIAPFTRFICRYLPGTIFAQLHSILAVLCVELACKRNRNPAMFGLAGAIVASGVYFPPAAKAGILVAVAYLILRIAVTRESKKISPRVLGVFALAGLVVAAPYIHATIKYPDYAWDSSKKDIADKAIWKQQQHGSPMAVFFENAGLTWRCMFTKYKRPEWERIGKMFPLDRGPASGIILVLAFAGAIRLIRHPRDSSLWLGVIWVTVGALPAFASGAAPRRLLCALPGFLVLAAGGLAPLFRCIHITLNTPSNRWIAKCFGFLIAGLITCYEIHIFTVYPPYIPDYWVQRRIYAERLRDALMEGYVLVDYIDSPVIETIQDATEKAEEHFGNGAWSYIDPKVVSPANIVADLEVSKDKKLTFIFLDPMHRKYARELYRLFPGAELELTEQYALCTIYGGEDEPSK